MIGMATAERPRVKIIAPYEPLPWQIPPWQDKAAVLLLTGSAGGGKSRLAAEKLHGFCKKYPGATALMIRKTRQSMTNSTVLFTERKIIGPDPSVHHFPSKNRFEYDNGSILAYGGMADDEQREQIRSTGQDGSVDIAWMEEATAFTEDDFNEVLARMRGKAAPWAQIILGCNPDAPTHWIARRLIEQGEAHVYYSGAMDNPHNPPAYIEALAKLTGVLGMRLRDGRWIQAEGAVYEEYDQTVHLIDPFTIPKHWRRIRVVDFGFTNPFVCQWWALDGDGRMYLYREIYMSQRTVKQHAEQMKLIEHWYLPSANGRKDYNPEREKAEVTVCDHDAEDIATLKENGFSHCREAVKDVSRGIQAVQERLRLAGDGRPRLFICRNALVEMDERMDTAKRPTSTASEFPAYVWPKSQDGRPIKEAPVKENDHGMDALRYAVMYVDRRRGDPFAHVVLAGATR